MGPGIFLIVLGALLRFAVEDNVPHFNLGAAGVILMLAGLAVAIHGWATEQRERTVVRRDRSSDPGDPTRIVEETTRDRWTR